MAPWWEGLVFFLALYGLIVAFLVLVERAWIVRPSRRGRPMVSLLLIVRNKEDIIEGLVRTLASLPYFTDKGSWAYELLVIDDFSSDDTWAIVKELASVYPQVRAFSMQESGELGESAVEVGYLMATNPIIITLNVEGMVDSRKLLDGVAYLLLKSGLRIEEFEQQQSPLKSV